MKNRKKIASFLLDIDQKIELLHDKKEEFIEFKHYLLQNLFPQNGKTATILRFGEAEIKYDNAGKTPWYTPTNCKNIQQQQPGLCTPCKDCQRIGNPLSYYNRKRKLLTRSGKNAAKTSH